MDPWAWWLIAAGVLVVAEILTTSLVFAMIAGGAASAAIVAALGRRHAAAGRGLRRRVDRAAVRRAPAGPAPHAHPLLDPARPGVAALVGAEAEVLEVVSGRDGRVKLSGEIWSARSYDGQSEFAPGESVRVIEISGATALVG